MCTWRREWEEGKQYRTVRKPEAKVLAQWKRRTYGCEADKTGQCEFITQEPMDEFIEYT